MEREDNIWIVPDGVKRKGNVYVHSRQLIYNRLERKKI